MKAVFKKVLYDELDIDFQKIYDLIVQKTGKDDFNALCDEFADNAKYYISETQDTESFFNKDNSITLLCGPKSFKFELTHVPNGKFECVNIDGISDMIDFFSGIETIDKTEAQKYFEDFKNKVIEEIDKNLM